MRSMVYLLVACFLGAGARQSSYRSSKAGNSVKSRNFRVGLVLCESYASPVLDTNEFATRARPSATEAESPHRTKSPQAALRKAKEKGSRRCAGRIVG